MPSTSQRWRRGTAAAAVVCLLIALSGTRAFAVVGTGNDEEQKGPCLSNGSQQWNGSTDQLYDIQSTPTCTFAANYCLDSWFDWATGGSGEQSGHFDARVARTCNSSVEVIRSSNDANRGRGLIGMQKAATCYGPNDHTSDLSSYCVNAPDATQTVVGAVVPNIPNLCTRSWRVDPGTSTIVYDSGGQESKSCNG